MHSVRRCVCSSPRFIPTAASDVPGEASGTVSIVIGPPSTSPEKEALRVLQRYKPHASRGWPLETADYDEMFVDNPFPTEGGAITWAISWWLWATSTGCLTDSRPSTSSTIRPSATGRSGRSTSWGADCGSSRARAAASLSGLLRRRVPVARIQGAIRAGSLSPFRRMGAVHDVTRGRAADWRHESSQDSERTGANSPAQHARNSPAPMASAAGPDEGTSARRPRSISASRNGQARRRHWASSVPAPGLRPCRRAVTD